MKKKVFVLALSFFTIFLFNDKLNAYSLGVHKKITINVIDNDVVKFNKYINDYTGLTNGVIEEINGKKVREWIEVGSWAEDLNWNIYNNPLYSHFYEPISNESGVGLNIFPSAYEWADHPSNNWSWLKAREYLYAGLTLTTKTEREKALADSFRAIGHIIHLVEDVSVPAHTRGDLHGIPIRITSLKEDLYEKYTNMKIGNLAYTSNPFPYWNVSVSSAAPKQFWDLDTFNGSSPYSGDYIGLSEYTNANYFSDDTIFKDFSYPDWASVEEFIIDINGRERIYLRKLGDVEGGYGESINYLATGKWFYKYIPSSLESLKKSSLKLDDKCFDDYQKKLIPKAVGYSAGLLDYFFRGTLEITPPDQVAYSVTDGSQTPYLDDYGNLHQQFTHIKSKVQNTTPKDVDIDGNPLTYEQIGPGTLVAVAKYKIIPNYNFDLSNYPPIVSPEDNIPDNMRDVTYSYSVSREITLSQTEIDSLNLSEAVEFTFDFTRQPPELDQPIPAGITNLSLQIIFKGTLGNEQDIAIAVGMKNLMEPTHQVLWNATDMFQLDGQLYTSDEIINTPSLFDRVDLDDDGQINEVSEGEPYIYPHDMTYSIGYLSAPPVSGDPFDYSAITVVEAGRHIRLISLVDKPQDNYLALEEDDDIVPWTSFFYYTFPGVINQEVNGVWQSPPTPMISFRYGLDIDGSTQIPIRQHSHNDFFGCYPMEGTDPYGNPSCYYPESEAIPAELLPSPIDTVSFP